MKMAKIAPLALVAVLAACASGEQLVGEIGPKPANWREEARAVARSTFYDPYSVRDATISEPVPVAAAFDGVTPIPQSGWMICIRANAKNAFGAYTGQKLTGLLFRNGRYVTTIQETQLISADLCGKTFTPFEV